MEYMGKVLGVKVIRSKWEGENKLPFYLLDRCSFDLAERPVISLRRM